LVYLFCVKLRSLPELTKDEAESYSDFSFPESVIKQSKYPIELMQLCTEEPF
jgi:hypothetical protein